MYTVYYVLPVLPMGSIVDEYIESFKFKQPNSNWSERQKWFWHHKDVARAGSTFKHFKNFFKFNQEREDICFIVKLETEKELSDYAKIQLYEKDELLHGSFSVPTKIPGPNKFEVSATTIKFDLKYTGDNITRLMKIIYQKKPEVLTTNLTDEGILQQQTLRKTIADSGNTEVIIENLDTNTAYGIEVMAGSDAGYGPKTEFEVITSTFGAPRSIKIKNRTADTLEISWKKASGYCIYRCDEFVQGDISSS